MIESNKTYLKSLYAPKKAGLITLGAFAPHQPGHAKANCEGDQQEKKRF
jgi:hypothetical protein